MSLGQARLPLCVLWNRAALILFVALNVLCVHSRNDYWVHCPHISWCGSSVLFYPCAPVSWGWQLALLSLRRYRCTGICMISEGMWFSFKKIFVSFVKWYRVEKTVIQKSTRNVKIYWYHKGSNYCYKFMNPPKYLCTYMLMYVIPLHK